MTRRRGNLVSAAVSTAAALLLVESGVRLLWSGAPVSPGSSDSLPVRQVRDPRVLYRLVPGSEGWYAGTPVSVNSLGLRDREYPATRTAGSSRVLLLGDSMVFGVGVPPEETLSAHLARRLPGTEAINAGIFGYNLIQQISLLREVGPRLRPDLVVACFVHNDIENWGLGEGGKVPEIRSSRFEPPPAGAWSTLVADLLLPDPFDPQRLSLLPSADSMTGARGRLAAWSRLYLFVYLRLRTHAWSLTGGERRDPIVGSPTCQAREIVWEPLRAHYRDLRSAARESGAGLAVVILGGWLWEGGPLERLHGILREEGIPFLDLTPVWLDGAFYARHYSLGWDPHPSAAANSLAADLVAEFIRTAGLLAGGEDRAAKEGGPGPHDALDRRPDLRQRLVRWRARQREALGMDSAAWSRRVGGLAPEWRPAAGVPGSDAGQDVYGFWETDPLLPGPVVSGRWMCDRSSVLLGGRPSARRVRIEIALPSIPSARRRTPASLRVTLGAPPDRCVAASYELPVGAASAEGPVVGFDAPLTADLAAAPALEVSLSVDRAYPASYLVEGGRDARLVSFFITRVALE